MENCLLFVLAVCSTASDEAVVPLECSEYDVGVFDVVCAVTEAEDEIVFFGGVFTEINFICSDEDGGVCSVTATSGL